MIKSKEIYYKYDIILDDTLAAFNALLAVRITNVQLYDSMPSAIKNAILTYNVKMAKFDEEVELCSSTYYDMLRKKRETVESRIALLTSRFGVEFTPFTTEKCLSFKKKIKQ